MKGIYTILLLLLSNVFMTLAWYGHLRLQETGVSKYWPLIGVIAFSWGIAFFEYCCQVPANRIGFEGTGGPFSLIQLKVIQEVVSLVVFTVIANLLFQGQQMPGHPRGLYQSATGRIDRPRKRVLSVWSKDLANRAGDSQSR